MRQKTNSGCCRQAGGASARAVRAGLAVAVALALAGGAAPARGEADAAETPSFEALLARGVMHSAGTDMRGGLEELRAAVRLDPGHIVARRELAIALLRAGRFGEAETEFSSVLGERRSEGLASGLLSAAELTGSVDFDIILGLATAVQFQGRAREADRLFRTYAELVGPMSKDAGRAYFRLHELAAESDVEWLDADAELAKALAVDPNIRSTALLPGLLDPRARPELEPYVRPIKLSGARADTAVEYDSLPALARWVAPADTSEALVALGDGELPLEILVGEDGLPGEVVPLVPVADEELAPLVSAVRAWRFTPAISNGAEAGAWILFGEEPDAATETDRSSTP